MDSGDDDKNKFFSEHYHESRYNLNNKTMLTAIICLVVVTVLVVILHLYGRWLIRRQSRRASRRHLTMGIVAMQVQSREPPKSGLDPSIIASLPIFIYKQTDPSDHEGGTNTIECAVCLSTLEEGEMARVLPNCKHTFHSQCIDMWLSSQLTCPICRTMAEPKPEPPVQPLCSDQSGVGTPPSAPPVDSLNCNSTSDGTSDCAGQCSKVGGSVSRLSSFKRIISRERSERRVQPCEEPDGVEDLEKQ